MRNFEHLFDTYPWLLPLTLLLALWEAIWKLIGLWRSARNSHLGWFIAIGIINSAGILPIIYLLLYPKKNDDVQQTL